MDITSAAIATIISSSVAAIVSFKINKSNAFRSLNDQLDSIIKIGIQYPYLESPAFTSTWKENKDSDDEKYLRYESYCTLVFNFMERVCKFYSFNSQKIESQLSIKDWIKTHKDCWLHPSKSFENTDGYDERFKKLMERYL